MVRHRRCPSKYNRIPIGTKREDHYISLVRRWIESGAPAIDGSIPKAGLPQIRLKGCLAMIGDTAFLERRPFRGPCCLTASETAYIFISPLVMMGRILKLTNNKISLHPNPHVFGQHCGHFRF
ncbi:MAG: hypothetical protein IPI30_21515 [Saprospiraceae bacterium]|nr:hypothetical protein [Candidatus Vicinibacter affinis]